MKIKVELEDITTVKKCLKVEVSADIALEEIDQVAKQYKVKARLPGFRPGKAPVELIKKHFQKGIRDDVLQRLIPKSYEKAIQEKEMKPISEPSLEHLTFEEEGPLVYEAHFEIQPEIDLPKYHGLKVTVESQPLTSEDVDEELDKLSEAHSRLITVKDQPIQEGNHVVIDLHGEYLEEEKQGHDSEPFQEEGVVVQIGDKHTHEAFNSALMGASVGEEKTFEVQYDPEYPEKKLAGHKLCFTVKVNEIKQKELPEINDEFAKDLGEYDTVKELREGIKERLQSQRERDREIDLRNKLQEKLVANTEFEVPEVLIENQIDGMLKDLAYKLASQGMDPSKADMDWMKVRSDFRPEAEKQVKVGMMLSEISRSENIEVSLEELEQEVEQMASSMDQPIENVKQYFQQEGRMDSLKLQLTQKKAMEILRESAEISDS